MIIEEPLHQHYWHYSELPLSQRVLYTATLLVLGLGYLFALVYLFHTQVGRDGKPSLSVDDVIITYSGTGKGSRLESALRGPMQTMLPADEMNNVLTWVQGGADRAQYEKDIRAVLDKRCMSCHDGSNPHLANFSSFEGLKKVTEQDTGTDVFTLVRVSHIHSFGLTFIFFIMGFMFSHAYLRPVWLKCVIVGLPFVAIVLDILSWYITKVYHPFAWVVIGAGAVMGMSFAFMWVTIMYQCWFSRTPALVAERTGGAARWQGAGEAAGDSKAQS